MDTPSRASIASEQAKHNTLLDVAAWLEAASSVPPRRKADYTSALATLAKVTGRPLEHLPAHAGQIRLVIEQRSPAEWGMKTASFRNFKSRVLGLLAMAGCRVVPGRHRQPLSPDWQALWGSLDKHRRLRYSLSHVMHWHSVNGISPDAAGPATFATYYKDAVEFGTKENRRNYYLDACRAWNKAAAQIPSWPKTPVEKPVARKPKTKPWSAFDPHLEAETRSYLASCAKPSFVGVATDQAALRPWHDGAKGKRRLLKPRTLKRREFDIRFLASMALDLGVPTERLVSLRDLVSFEVINTVLGHLWKQAGDKTTTYIAGFAWTLRSIAKNFVQVDEDDLKRLTHMCVQLEPNRRDMTAKNRIRLDQLRPAEQEQAFLRLPDTLARRARQNKVNPEKAARLMMNACIVALLTYCPMRVGNLAGLDLDKHIRRLVEGKTRKMLIEIPGAEVKNGVPTRYPVPAPVATLIEEYLAHHRGAICGVSCSWLFPTRRGKAVHQVGMSTRISKPMWRELGLRWHAHLFRHWGASTFDRDHPGEHETIRRFLHHEKIETSRNYLGNDGEAAVRRYQETILKRRNPRGPAPVDEL